MVAGVRCLLSFCYTPHLNLNKHYERVSGRILSITLTAHKHNDPNLTCRRINESVDTRILILVSLYPKAYISAHIAWLTRAICVLTSRSTLAAHRIYRNALDRLPRLWKAIKSLQIAPPLSLCSKKECLHWPVINSPLVGVLSSIIFWDWSLRCRSRAVFTVKKLIYKSSTSPDPPHSVQAGLSDPKYFWRKRFAFSIDLNYAFVASTTPGVLTTSLNYRLLHGRVTTSH